VDEVEGIGDAKIAPDGAGLGVGAEGRAHHLPGNGDGVFSLQGDDQHGTAGHEFHQAFVKALALMGGVVGFGGLLGDLHELQADDLKALVLKTREDLTAKSALASGVTDPNVTFAGGATSYSFVVKANTTTVPTVQIQAGTVAETITITPTLTANGTNVTPATLAPINIVVPAAVPTATAATLTRNGNQLTVAVTGFSNTREIVQANFHFVPVAGATLSTTDLTAPVGDEFATWFASPGGLQLGSTFLYTQNFNVVDGDASKIASVQVTLTNSVGVSVAESAQ